MTDLRRHLQAGDPLRHEPALAPDHVERMRRVIVEAAREPRPRVSATAFALLAGLTTAAAAGVWAVGGAPPVARATGPASLAANVSAPDRHPSPASAFLHAGRHPLDLGVQPAIRGQVNRL